MRNQHEIIENHPQHSQTPLFAMRFSLSFFHFIRLLCRALFLVGRPAFFFLSQKLVTDPHVKRFLCGTIVRTQRAYVFCSVSEADITSDIYAPKSDTRESCMRTSCVQESPQRYSTARSHSAAVPIVGGLLESYKSDEHTLGYDKLVHMSLGSPSNRYRLSLSLSLAPLLARAVCLHCAYS